MSPDVFPGDPRVEDALSAAQMYYQQGITMEAIARELQISRSTVSRLLSFARQTGLVEIRVLPPSSQVADLERVLTAGYAVQAHVVHVPPTATAAERVERTANHAARLLNSVVDSDMVIGISWGTMVNAISRCLIPKPTTNSQIVQLNGLGNSRATDVHYANTLMSAFSNAWGAYVQQLPLPLFFDSSEARDLLFKERSIQHIVELQAAADVVLFSVGTVTNGVPSSPYTSGYFLDESDFSTLLQDGVVGDVATTFFRGDGAHEGVRFNRHTSGPDPMALKQVQHRICVASGDHKVDALHAALLGGYVSELVLDDLTANLLIERHQAVGPDRRKGQSSQW